jgi:hypothetical protein
LAVRQKLWQPLFAEGEELVDALGVVAVRGRGLSESAYLSEKIDWGLNWVNRGGRSWLGAGSWG